MIRRIVSGVLAVLFAVASFGYAPLASATAPDYGRAIDHWYYTGQYDWDASYMFAPSPDIPYAGFMLNPYVAPDNYMDANIFIESVRIRLWSPTDHNRARASILVNMMLGIDGDDPRYDNPSANRWENGVVIAQSRFAEWSQLIHDYEDAGQANFNATYYEVNPEDWSGAVSAHTGFPSPPANDAIHHTLTETINGPTVEFYDKLGNPLMIFLKNCANLLGRAAPLPEIKPPVTTSCAGVLGPVNGGVGSLYSFTVGVRLSEWRSYFVANSNPALTVTVTDPGGSPVPIVPASPPYSVSPPPVVVTSDSASFTPGVAGIYHIAWRLLGDKIDQQCSSDIEFGYHPYFSTTGGDIMSGGIIQSWNRDGASGSYDGAGSQMAALASGLISNFVTGVGLNSGVATNTGSALAFANTTKSGSAYGGNYAVSAVPNFASDATSQPGSKLLASGTISAADLAGLTTGVYTYNGNITIHGGTVPIGQNITIVATGAGNGVYVDGNITYPPYSAFSQIPRFNVYTTEGNIYVDNDVTELHGVYYSGGSGANGNFYTCSTGSGAPVNLATSPTGYDDCNHQLTVYGAVATANKLVLSRTYGHLLGAPPRPAENFYYSPELWMTPGYNASGSNTVKYDSYRVLPPVL